MAHWSQRRHGGNRFTTVMTPHANMPPTIALHKYNRPPGTRNWKNKNKNNETRKEKKEKRKEKTLNHAQKRKKRQLKKKKNRTPEKNKSWKRYISYIQVHTPHNIYAQKIDPPAENKKSKKRLQRLISPSFNKPLRWRISRATAQDRPESVPKTGRSIQKCIAFLFSSRHLCFMYRETTALLLQNVLQGHRTSTIDHRFVIDHR